MAIFEHDGRVFDSAKAPSLTFGDVAELEDMGVNLQDAAKANNVGTTLKVALVCFRKMDPTVDEAFVKGIPIASAGGLTEFIQDFFTKNFPDSAALS